MYEQDDIDEWADGEPAAPSRAGLAAVAIIILVPFVMLVGGGANAVDALGPEMLGVVIFFGTVALTFVLIRRWLRRRLLGGPSGAGGSFWSDRR